MTRSTIQIVLLLLLALAAPAGAEEAGKPAPPEQPAAEAAALPVAGEADVAVVGEASPAPQAAPAGPEDPAAAPPAGPGLGMPGRTEPAASRGPNGCPERIQALAPVSGVGRTAEASPVLQFSLDEATDCRIEFVLNDPREAMPLVEREIAGPHAPGVHAISLAAFGVKLEPGVVYTWYVQLVPDPQARSKDVFSGAPIQRVAASQGALWYDELAARGSRLAASPGDPAAREAWRELLAAQQLGPGTAKPDVAAGPGR